MLLPFASRVCYSSHEALKYWNSQSGVNPKHARWVKSISMSTRFYLSISMMLRIRSLMPSVIFVIFCTYLGKVLSFDRVEDAYSSCFELGLAFSKLLDSNCRPYVKFILHDGYLFQGFPLCIPWTHLETSLFGKCIRG